MAEAFFYKYMRFFRDGRRCCFVSSATIFDSQAQSRPLPPPPLLLIFHWCKHFAMPYARVLTITIPLTFYNPL